MKTLSETKSQRWRAIAVRSNGDEALIYLGGNILQVRENYLEAFNSYQEPEEQLETVAIRVEKWVGMPYCGNWITHAQLLLPKN